jgi:hypothetical protein
MPLHLFTIAIPRSTTLRTPEDASRWIMQRYKMSGYVEGGPVEGKPGVFAWFFFFDPCYKTQMSQALLVVLDSIEKGEKVQIYFGKPDKKGNRPYHYIVRSNKPYHRQETAPVDAELFAQWDGKSSFQEFLYERDPSLKDASLQFIQFGSFEPEPLKD